MCPSVFDIFGNILNFWKILATFDNIGHIWPFLAISTFLAILSIFLENMIILVMFFVTFFFVIFCDFW